MTVIPLRGRKTKGPEERERPMPERFSAEELRRLLEWGAREHLTLEQIEHARDRVKDWSEGSGSKRINWVAVVRNAIRGGWALEGFEASMARRRAVDPEFRQHALTSERIERIVARRAAEED